MTTTHVGDPAAAAEGASWVAEHRGSIAPDDGEQPQRHGARTALVRGVHIIPPDGTFYSLPDFRAYSKNSVELCDFLLIRLWS